MARITAIFVMVVGVFVACSDRSSSSAVEVPTDAGDSSAIIPDRATTDESVPIEPTPYDPTANVVVDDLRFIEVDGERFFALGLHASPGLTYDGATGPGECDKDAGLGYLDINIDKTHAAAAAGANFVYMWGYEDETPEMIDVMPRFKGIFHGSPPSRVRRASW